MKKILVLTVTMLFAISLNANAQSTQGGFQNDTYEVITVTEVAKLKDGDYVVLEGNIIEKTGNEAYNFKDNTGTILIEIDDEDWNGTNVTPNDTVIIEGEIDKDMTGPTIIEVDTIRMAK